MQLLKTISKNNLTSLDNSIDAVLEEIKHNSEDFHEREFFCSKWYVEIQHNIEGWEKRSHFFAADGNYIVVEEGRSYTGRWFQPDNLYNRIVVEWNKGGMNITDVYDSAFIGEKNCMVLTKHGSPVRRGEMKYICLLSERIWDKDLAWYDYLEILRQEGMSNNLLTIFISVFLFIALITIIVLSAKEIGYV